MYLTGQSRDLVARTPRFYFFWWECGPGIRAGDGLSGPPASIPGSATDSLRDLRQVTFLSPSVKGGKYLSHRAYIDTG